MATTVGDRIREARERAGKTQAELSEAADLNQPTLSRYEAGKCEPSVAPLAKIAEALGVRLEWLATGQKPIEARRATEKVA